MECNKDEAARAKEIAEKKFAAKDFAGAKKFAVKAQNLYPMLEGIAQMIATLEVYVAAENKAGGEADWYGILGVTPQADDEMVRKQYRKLALILHPDKNKSVGADGAFKFISEAWSILSDKTRRLIYDQKRIAKVSQKVSTPAGTSSATPTNGFYNFTKPNVNVKTHKSTHKTSNSSSQAQSYKAKPNTFWTVCHRCKMQYEYLRVYLNHKLLCPNCHEPFVAIETPPPTTSASKSSPWNFSQQARPPNVRTDGSNGQTTFQWGPFSRTGGASTAAQAASVVQQAYEKVKREREEAQAAIKREEALKRKNNTTKSSSGQPNAAKRRKGMEDVSQSSHGGKFVFQFGTGSGGAGLYNASGLRPNNIDSVRLNGITKPYGMKDAFQVEIQTLLLRKAETDIQNKLNEWKSTSVSKSSLNDGVGAKPDIPDLKKPSESLNKATGAQEKKSSSNMSGAKEAEALEDLSINVPDPDFHDFDKDRTERCFGENQIWAAYDDDDGMPRYYAMIHNVVSVDPFKMKISWLNSKTNTELGPINWIGSGFSKTCGDFRIGRSEIYDSLNSFSHKVRWTKGSRGVIHIYPKKGDVWAIYRNWSPDWNELTADEVIHKYDMVEVLEDFTEDLGVTVTPLVKVAGFKTVFHRHLDPREIRRIPKEEMFQFSHIVPSYLLTGQEGPNAPKGCHELDPAAVPSELLQVVENAREEEVIENEAKSSEDKVTDDVENTNNNQTRTISETDKEENVHSREEVEIVEDSAESEDERKDES